MKINRLFEITYILLEKKKVTATELSKHFGVSRRTICRDIDLLSVSGIPIYADKGRNGGISLLDNFTLNKSFLSIQEQDDILASLEGLKALKYPDASLALDKLRHLFCKSNNDWIAVDFSHWGSDKSEQEKFIKIKASILDRKVIMFEYLNTFGQIRNHCVEPLLLWFKEKAWYLKAYSPKHSDYRLYKITRIRNITICDQVYERQLPTDNEMPMKVNYELITLKLRFSKEMAYRVFDEFSMEDISAEKDGSFSVTVEYPLSDWIYGYILSFGKNVQVMEPVSVKNRIIELIDDMRKSYIE